MPTDTKYLAESYLGLDHINYQNNNILVLAPIYTVEAT